MNNKTGFIFSVCLLTLQFLHVNTSYALESPEVRITAQPAWVKTNTFGGFDLKDKSEISGGEYFLLVDEQTNALKSKQNYKHFAIKLLNETAVTENSRLSIDFAPGYQSLEIHGVSIWRNGNVIHQAIENKIKLLQREKELENLIYDGRWTATLLLDDIRKGDILEYSYTRKGQNPAYKGNIGELVQLQWHVPVEKQKYRLLWPDELPLSLKKINVTKEEISISSHIGYKEYQIERIHAPTLQVDSETPTWYDPWDRVIFSSISTWKEVADWGIELYKSQSDADTEINAVAKDIHARYEDKLQQASAALRYVQDEIRYVGIEVGAGGFVPTPAKDTIKRRYGDCKDKTYLLISILKALDIEAYPALANTDYGENISEDGPKLNSFNHVLVKVFLNDKSYWLETTTTNQASTIDKIYQPDYGQALLLKPGTDSLTTMYQDQPYHKVIYDEVFDLKEGVNKKAKYTVQTTLIGHDAEKFRRSLGSKGKSKIVKEYLDYYTKLYKDIAIAKDISIIDDKIMNKVVVTEQYAVPGIWTDNKNKQKYNASFYNDAVYSYVSKPETLKRTSPYNYHYPVNLQQNITVLLPETWNLEDESKELKTPFFNYSYTGKYDLKENKLRLEYKFKTLKKYISANEIGEYVKAINQLKSIYSYSIYYSYADEVDIVEDDWATTLNILMILAGLLVLLFFYAYVEFRMNQKKSPSADSSKYYPVATSKVFILSVVTYGFYLFYWFYKNWFYVKHRERSLIIPWGRAFFYTIWFYPFYKTLSRDETFPNMQPSAWRDFRYGLIAIVFIVSMVITNSEHVLSYVALFVLSACVLPLVEKINHLTTPADEYYQFNSKWRSRHFIFMFLFLLLSLFDMSSRVNFIPSDAVVRGEALWNRDIKYMYRIGVLSPEEKLLLFYSDAFLSFKEDGNGLSTTGVFSYWRDEDTGELNTEMVNFDNIADIKYTPVEYNADTIQIKRKDGTNFVLYAKNTNDLNFYIDLMRHWNNVRGKL